MVRPNGPLNTPLALAQIQMIAVRHSVFCIDFMPFFICCRFFRLRHDVTVHTAQIQMIVVR